MWILTLTLVTIRLQLPYQILFWFLINHILLGTEFLPELLVSELLLDLGVEWGGQRLREWRFGLINERANKVNCLKDFWFIVFSIYFIGCIPSINRCHRVRINLKIIRWSKLSFVTYRKNILEIILMEKLTDFLICSFGGTFISDIKFTILIGCDVCFRAKNGFRTHDLEKSLI